MVPGSLSWAGGGGRRCPWDSRGDPEAQLLGGQTGSPGPGRGGSSRQLNLQSRGLSEGRRTGQEAPGRQDLVQRFRSPRRGTHDPQGALGRWPVWAQTQGHRFPGPVDLMCHGRLIMGPCVPRVHSPDGLGFHSAWGEYLPPSL